MSYSVACHQTFSTRRWDTTEQRRVVQGSPYECTAPVPSRLIFRTRFQHNSVDAQDPERPKSGHPVEGPPLTLAARKPKENELTAPSQ
jgi:hypothetical protein